MADVLDRARALYSDAHAADDRGWFSDALTTYRALLRLLDHEGSGVPESARDVAKLRARASLGIARATYETSADLAGASTLLDTAERICVEAGLDEDLVAVRGQRGLLLMRSGELDAALAEWDRIAAATDTVATLDLGVTLLNRGALRLELRDPARAVSDLRAAADVGRRLGNTVLEGNARHNLGYCAFLLGDLPTALREMAEAAPVFADDDPVGDIDRSRVLAEAGLLGDAVAALERALTLLDGGSASALVRAEVELSLATCFVDLGRHAKALAAARAAAEAFTTAGNALWAARARTVELEALLADDRYTQTRSPVPTLLERARQAAAHADQGATGGVAGRMAVTYPALLAAAEWSALAGDLTAARAYLGRVPANLENAPLALRLTCTAVGARIAFASGHRASGVRAIRHGQKMLSAHRGLGSVEAVAASGVHAMQLNLVDTQAALATGDAAALFDALERGRAAAAGAARLVPPDDAALAGLLGHARAEHQAALALGPTADPEGLRRKRQHLRQARRYQEMARERSWQIEGERRPVEPMTARAVRAALRGLDGPDGETVVVSYVTFGGQSMAVRVDAHGQSLHTLAARDDVFELARRARADLAVVANPLIPAMLRDAAGGSLARALARLDELLLAPLGVEGGLYVVGRGHHLTIPWTALPSRAGRRTWVQDRVDVRPGLTEPGALRSERVVVIAGPDTDGGPAEVNAVADVWPGAQVVTGGAATTTAAVSALRDADVVHIAAHGSHSADNAMFSTLRLTDGPLFAHELDGVDLTGSVVVLSACELGESTSGVGGEELGFASVLLRHGARAVVAAVGPLRDDVAVRVMPRLHEGLRDGLPPGAALAAATAGEPEPVPLVCFGPLLLRRADPAV